MAHLHPDARVGIVVEGAPGTVWIAAHPHAATRLLLCCGDATTLLRLAQLMGLAHEGAAEHPEGAAVAVDKAQSL